MFGKTLRPVSSDSQDPAPSRSATPGLAPRGPPPAVLCVVGFGSDTVAESVKRDLETILQQHLTEEDADGKDFYRPHATTKLETIQVKTRSLGASPAPTRVQREERVVEETGAVQWSLQDKSGAWRELSLYAICVLEQAHRDQSLSVEIKGLHGEKMKVNLVKQEAKDCHTGVIYKVKREETKEKEAISQTAPTLPIEEKGDGIRPVPDASNDRRIVVFGKTGTGKSSIGNTIFGEQLFRTNDSPTSETASCQTESRVVHGRNITVIDTPGFFDTTVSEEHLKPEITRCLAECAAGPHAILIVLKVERFTTHENDVFTKICQYFSPEALRHAIVLFTHGNQLGEGVTIEEFVSRSPALKDLVGKCGGRCHVLDNTYWNSNLQGTYRSNQFQVAELLNTIDEMVKGEGYFTNEMLQDLEAIIQIEEAGIRNGSSGNVSEKEIRRRAKKNLFQTLFVRLAGATTGAILGALLGAVSGIVLLLPQVKMVMQIVKDLRAVAQGAGFIGLAGVGTSLTTIGIAAGRGVAAGDAAWVIAGTGAVVGAVAGGYIGYNAAERAETVGEAVMMAAHDVQTVSNDVIKKGKAAIRDVKGFLG